MKKLFSLFILLILLSACSNKLQDDGTTVENRDGKTVVTDDNGNTLEIDDKNAVSRDASGKVLLNSTDGSGGWCPIGTTVKSDVAYSNVLAVEEFNIEGFGVCKACHYVQDSPDYNIKLDWWTSEDGKCKKTITSDAQGNITLEKWVNAEGKECGRQFFGNDKTFEDCS